MQLLSMNSSVFDICRPGNQNSASPEYINLHMLEGLLYYHLKMGNLQCELQIYTNLEIAQTNITYIAVYVHNYGVKQSTEFGLVIRFMVCLKPVSTIFQLYRSDQFYCWRTPEYPEKTTDLSQIALSPNVVLSRPRHERGSNSQLQW